MLALKMTVALASDGGAANNFDLFQATRLQKVAMQARHGHPVWDYAAITVRDCLRTVTDHAARLRAGVRSWVSSSLGVPPTWACSGGIDPSSRPTRAT
jgi:hypothetical protein